MNKSKKRDSSELKSCFLHFIEKFWVKVGRLMNFLQTNCFVGGKRRKKYAKKIKKRIFLCVCIYIYIYIYIKLSCCCVVCFSYLYLIIQFNFSISLFNLIFSIYIIFRAFNQFLHPSTHLCT